MTRRPRTGTQAHASGRELWLASLPASGSATPFLDRRCIAATGIHSMAPLVGKDLMRHKSRTGDSLWHSFIQLALEVFLCLIQTAHF